MSLERYTVECLAGGQPRPHADAWYRYRVTIEWQGVIKGNESPKDKPFIPRPELDKRLVMQILKGLCGGWVDEPGAFDRQLSRAEMVAPGVWEVLITEPYTG